MTHDDDDDLASVATAPRTSSRQTRPHRMPVRTHWRAPEPEEDELESPVPAEEAAPREPIEVRPEVTEPEWVDWVEQSMRDSRATDVTDPVPDETPDETPDDMHDDATVEEPVEDLAAAQPEAPAEEPVEEPVEDLAAAQPEEPVEAPVEEPVEALASAQPEAPVDAGHDAAVDHDEQDVVVPVAPPVSPVPAAPAALTEPAEPAQPTVPPAPTGPAEPAERSPRLLVAAAVAVVVVAVVGVIWWLAQGDDAETPTVTPPTSPTAAQVPTSPIALAGDSEHTRIRVLASGVLAVEQWIHGADPLTELDLAPPFLDPSARGVEVTDLDVVAGSRAVETPAELGQQVRLTFSPADTIYLSYRLTGALERSGTGSRALARATSITLDHDRTAAATTIAFEGATLLSLACSPVTGAPPVPCGAAAGEQGWRVVRPPTGGEVQVMAQLDLDTNG